MFVFIFLCLQAYSLKSELNGTIIVELNHRYHQLDKFTRYRGVEKVQWVNFMYKYMCILSITSYLIGRIHGNIVNGDIYGNMYMFALCYIYLLWSIEYWVNNKKKHDVKVNEKVLEGHKQRLEKIRMRRLVLEIMDVLEFRPSSEANGKRIGEASHPGPVTNSEKRKLSGYFTAAHNKMGNFPPSYIICTKSGRDVGSQLIGWLALRANNCKVTLKYPFMCFYRGCGKKSSGIGTGVNEVTEHGDAVDAKNVSKLRTYGIPVAIMQIIFFITVTTLR